jgi:succinate-semialdehyde dehydrogenase/glutarate-semialdehyde dehydrogenase
MITRKCAPAMAAGCPFIVKPAPDTPFSALALAVLAEEAGVPAGIFNVVTGDAVAIGGELTANDKVKKLSFTGSTNIGKLLMGQCANTVKKVSLELGGNAPFIIFDDADIDSAIEGAMASKFRNAGQTCVCTNRFLVQEGVHDLFVEKLTQAVESLQVGNGLEAGISQGPLINDAAISKIEDHVADAIAKGACLNTGGNRHALGGTFYEPTVISGVTPEMKVAKEETFGPLAPIFSFKTEEDALQMANDSEFGLAAYIYTRDLGRSWRMGEGLEYGMVGINEGIISTTVAPFGGIKQSGIGREGSKYGIEDYVEIKYLMVGGI